MTPSLEGTLNISLMDTSAAAGHQSLNPKMLTVWRERLPLLSRMVTSYLTFRDSLQLRCRNLTVKATIVSHQI